MGRHKTNENLVRHHIWLDKDDAEKIQILYGDSLGFSKAVRLMLRKFLESVEARASQIARPVSTDLALSLEPDQDGRS